MKRKQNECSMRLREQYFPLSNARYLNLFGNRLFNAYLNAQYSINLKLNHEIIYYFLYKFIIYI